jgi:hypothetical protein
MGIKIFWPPWRYHLTITPINAREVIASGLLVKHRCHSRQAAPSLSSHGRAETHLLTQDTRLPHLCISGVLSWLQRVAVSTLDSRQLLPLSTVDST